MPIDLATELTQVEAEIAEAASQYATLAGGLLKALIAVRLEILRTTRVLLRQRMFAEEGGAALSVQIPASVPDERSAAALATEVEAQQRALEAARADAARFAGGLVHALKLSTVATQEQSLSMLRQRYLIAMYGLALPSVEPIIKSDAPATPISPPNIQPQGATAPQLAFLVRLLKKQLTKQNHQDFIFFDTELTASGLKRPSRAIKGQLLINDLFGETKLTIGWTLEKPLNPGESLIERGKGFHYNQFLQPHQWVNDTALENMSAVFAVSGILYQDGSREDF
jgi:hypothetical protein